MSKTSDTSTFVPGQVVAWTIVVQNPGPSDAQQVVIVDAVDPGVSGVTVSGGGCVASPCTIATLAAGTTVTVHVSGTLSAAYTAATLDNLVTVTSATTGATPTVASSSTPVLADAALSVTKTADLSPFVPGQAVGWTIVVTNAGPSDAQSVVVDDPVDPAVTNVTVAGSGCTVLPCTIPTLAAGASATINVTGTLPASTLLSSVANTVTASSATTAGATFSATVSTPVVPAAAFDVTKTAARSPFVAGQSVDWTISVTNTGPSDAQGVVVADTIDPAVTAVVVTGGCTALPCTIPTLAAGATVQIAVSGTLAAGFTGTLDNVAHVTSTTTGATDFPATSSTPVVAVSTFSVSKVAGAATFVPGQAVSWVITVDNTGPSTAVNIPVSDAIPAGVTGVAVSGACTTLPCTIASLAPGQVATIDVAGTLVPSFAGLTLSNSVTATEPSSGAPFTATSVTPVVPGPRSSSPRRRERPASRPGRRCRGRSR